MAEKFPRAYVNSVPKEGKEPMMKTVDFDRMGIGARSSGMPKNAMAEGSLDHVGGTAGGAKK